MSSSGAHRSPSANPPPDPAVETNADVRAIVAERAALRRIATLAARAVSSEELFAAVNKELARLVGADAAALLRFEPDDLITLLAAWNAAGAPVAVGDQQPVNAALRRLRDSIRPIRCGPADVPLTGPFTAETRKLGIRATVAVPIQMDVRVWGVSVVGSQSPEPFPATTEARMAKFAELVATAISNTGSRGEPVVSRPRLIPAAGDSHGQWRHAGIREPASANREAEIRELKRLAAEQAALRRVATLVAAQASQVEIFNGIAEECARLFGTPAIEMFRYDGDSTIVVASTGPFAASFPRGSRHPLGGENISTRILQTGNAARVDDYETASGPIGETAVAMGLRSALGHPIVVDGQLWGGLIIGVTAAVPMRHETAARLGEFTELMATAIADTESRAKVERLAAEQTALQRVATLVAQNVPADELFGAVAREVGTLFGADYSAIIRYEPDTAFVTTLAAWAAVGEPPPRASRFRIAPGDPATTVADTGRPVRVEEWGNLPGPRAEFMFSVLRVKSSVGTPIIVQGRLWGALAVHSKHAAFPPGTEGRIERFTELVATAIANTDGRAEISRLAEEQAALRRVATMVARESSAEEIFATVAKEVARMLGVEAVTIQRYEPEGDALIVGDWGREAFAPLVRSGVKDAFRVGTRLKLDGESVSATIHRTGRPASFEYASVSGAIAADARALGLRSGIGIPIVVGGRPWGAIIAATTRDARMPAQAESRMAKFTELLATAITNAESRSEVKRLADEQAALRRVATLVAEGAPPAAVFDAVAVETERALGAGGAALFRYEPDEEVTVVAQVTGPHGLPPGVRISHKGHNVSSMVRRSGRAARIDDYDRARGPLADAARAVKLKAAVGAPIIVDGRTWGVIIATWPGEGSPPADTEERMAKFAGLLGTAVANADSSDQLTASRARLVTEAHEARRSVVRDLHDGAQQGLVHTIITLKLARRALDEGRPDLAPLMSDALGYAQTAHDELRDLVHGILPSALTREGLRAAVDDLAARMSIPVEIDIGMERFAPLVEATAYFVVAEALTNVVKHARAKQAEVSVSVKGETLHVQVRDSGVGGANLSSHGLVGLTDRVTALDGRLSIESPPQGGTTVAATLPLNSNYRRAQSAGTE